MNEPTTPCMWCRVPTRMLGTCKCDRCWELETRIRSQPELARRMLEQIEKVRQMANAQGGAA